MLFFEPMEQPQVKTAPVVGAARAKQLDRLTVFRGLAALMVFAYHVYHVTGWSSKSWVASYGFVGVAFFFCLSGYVLRYTWRNTEGARTFYARRFAKVYPLHFVTGIAALVFGLNSLHLVWPAVIPNFLLLQAWVPVDEIAFGVNSVSWSLSCEAFFYLGAPFVFAYLRRTSTRNAVLAVLVWWAACSAVSICFGVSGSAFDVGAYTNPLLRSGEFGLGVLAAELHSRRWRPKGPLWVYGLVVAATLVALTRLSTPQTIADVAVTLPVLGVIVVSADRDLSGVRTILTSKLLVFAGNASFAFYLVHEQVLNFYVRIFGHGASGPRGVFLILCALGTSMVLASVLHLFLEKPVQRWILRHTLRSQ
ncbi:acyltransferase [Arthrobacter sp. A333]|nr:acyltransferase [Arthrobacter sp. YJM1]